MKTQLLSAAALAASVCFTGCVEEDAIDMDELEAEDLDEDGFPIAAEFDEEDLEDEDLEDEDLDDEALEDEDEDLPEDEEIGEADAFAVDIDPMEAGANDGPRIGGSSGTLREARCPAGMVGVGTVVIRESGGARIRHLALVCGPQWRVESSLSIPQSQQWVIATGFTSQVWPYIGHSAKSQSRVSYNLEMATESTIEDQCDAGYAMRGIRARVGSLVDRIESLNCIKLAPGGGQWIYPEAVNLGGWGGTSRATYCPGWPDAVDGLHFRDGSRLVAIGSLCDDT